MSRRILLILIPAGLVSAFVLLEVVRTLIWNATGGPAMNLQSVSSQVEPALVRIVAEKDEKGDGTMDQTSGSGMVVTSSGEVLTNDHVIAHAFNIMVRVPGSSNPYPATVIGADPSADLALIKLDGVSNLPTVTMASAPDYSVGRDVAAIGYPQGNAAPSASQGTILYQNQSLPVLGENGVEHLSGALQITAPIANGDSGGALTNSSGQVIGMLTAGLGGTTIGYAIPSISVQSVVSQIRSGRASAAVTLGTQPYLGMTYLHEAMDAESPSGRSYSGADIVSVTQGSPAARTNLQQSDLIIALDGARISSPDALQQALQAHKPGDRIVLTYVDRNKPTGPHTVGLTVGAIA